MFMPSGSATVQVNDEISDRFGGIFRIIIETGTDWDRTQALVAALEAEVGARRVLSEVTLARWLGDLSVRPDAEDLARLPAGAAEQLRSASGASRIFVAVPEPMRNDAALAAQDRIVRIAEQQGATRIFGLPVIMRSEAIALIDQLSLGLLVAAIGGTVLVAAAFG